VARAEAYLRAKFHLDPSNRLATIHQLHRQTDRTAQRTDSIGRTVLQTVAQKLVRLLESLYEGTMSAARVNGGLTEWFVTVIGVMQGCVLSPLLFNILLEVVMALALDNWESAATPTTHNFASPTLVVSIIV